MSRNRAEHTAEQAVRTETAKAETEAVTTARKTGKSGSIAAIGEKAAERARKREVKAEKKAVKRERRAAKRAARKQRPPRRSFVTGRFLWYLALLIFALIFTQMLRSVLSAVAFMGLLLLGPACLIYLLWGKRSIFSASHVSDTETYKGAPITFEVGLTNESILPYPYAEADILIPGESAVRCERRRVRLSLMPKGSCTLSEEVRFPYRGCYQIGTERIYLYDPLGLFRLTVKEDYYAEIFVKPRRIRIPMEAHRAVADVNTDSSRDLKGVDRAEMNEIKPYHMGDAQKNIHWKLSGKTEELMVKHYAMNAGRTVCIFVDMAAHFPVSSDYADDINEAMGDAVIEMALAAASKELVGGNACRLVWFDHRFAGDVQICHMDDPEDLEAVFHAFATAPLCTAERNVTELITAVGELQELSLVFVTNHLDMSLAAGLERIPRRPNSAANRADVYYCPPEGKLLSATVKEEYRKQSDYCREQLKSGGFSLQEFTPAP